MNQSERARAREIETEREIEREREKERDGHTHTYIQLEGGRKGTIFFAKGWKGLVQCHGPLRGEGASPNHDILPRWFCYRGKRKCHWTLSESQHA